MSQHKVVVTCALTGVLTDPKETGVPVTPKEMAAAAFEAYNAGASVVHCHFRQQEPGKGHLATWDPDVVADICAAIKARVPKILINMSTGTIGPDTSGAIACLKRVKPELAALNAGSLNYLKIKKDGSWAWPPFLFDNPVEKVSEFLQVMYKNNILPECECFDTGILRSVSMFRKNGMLRDPVMISLVMGIASGMPAKPEWLPLLINEMPKDGHWQTIVIGREDVWPVIRKTVELGGDVRTGLEDTFYLPDGKKTKSNGDLISAAVKIIHAGGREVATPEEARQRFGLRVK